MRQTGWKWQLNPAANLAFRDSAAQSSIRIPWQERTVETVTFSPFSKHPQTYDGAIFTQSELEVDIYGKKLF